MTLDEAEHELDEDDLESLWCLMNIRCPLHGEMVMMQGTDGRILFWCGCARNSRALENTITKMDRKTVKAKH